MSSRAIRDVRQSLERVLTSSQVDGLLEAPLDSANFGELEIILSKGEPVAFAPQDCYFPTLKGLLRVGVGERTLTVDMGAVPYVTNGADIMAPGVVSAHPDLVAGDMCIVVEERHQKPLSVAKMLVDARDLRTEKRGKVAKNLHFVGDALWKVVPE